MTEQIGKASPKPVNRRSDILENQSKLRSILRNGSRGSTMKSEIPAFYKPSARPSCLDAASKTYYGKCYEDQQVRLKLLELTPRNPAKQTSEGVQEFIKQVSNFIEKKNPFKDNVRHSFGRFERNDGSSSFDSVSFRLNEKLEENKKFTFLTGNLLDKNNERSPANSSCYLDNLNWEERNLEMSANKTPEKISQGKKSRINGPAREKSQSEKKRKKGEESSNKKCAELKRVITLNENPIFYYENERRSFSMARNEKKSNEGSNKQNQGKKRKPSEIPLRKNRKDGTKNPKPVSLFLKKPLKDVDSSVSIDLFSKKKPFSPIEELSHCSEIQITINAIGSSEKITQSCKTSDSELIKNNYSEDSLKSTRLSRCCKNPNLPVETNFSCVLLADDETSVGKKNKVLDIEKLKTSSFTVLRSNTTVLNRLESLHKRNVSSKEKATRSSSKSKLTTSKSSFCSVREKNPKSSLSYRLCSKGSKLNLKTKGKKNKKETDENFSLPKKRSKTKNKTSLEICKEIIATGKVDCLIPGVCKRGKGENKRNPTRSEESDSNTNLNKGKRKKESKSNLPVKLSKRKGKSNPKKFVTSREKELRTPLSSTPVASRMKIEDFLNYEKPESTKSSNSSKKSDIFILRDDEKSELYIGLKPDKVIPHTPPPTPLCNSDILETSDGEGRPEEDDESSTKTVILDDTFNQEDVLWCVDEVEDRKKRIQTRNDPDKEERLLKESAESEAIKNLRLVIRGTSLDFAKDEPPEKPESADSAKVKMELKIDLNAQNKISAPEEDMKNSESFDWLYLNGTKYDGELDHQNAESKDLENEGLKKKISNPNFNHNEPLNLINSEITEEKKKHKPFDSVFRKPRKCCSSLKRRMQYKTSSVNIKGVRKKMRSDAGDRRLPANSFFNSDLSLQKKSQGSPKNLKSGLNEDEQRDLFEDVAAVKLRRRNSEPHSFKEFVWKRTDFAMPKGLKPSVSSMASSLRHLNTDDIDDFIFWEPVPQKLTSCWETSLYHFKKPWTVLSCSVFKDNRQSNTPGLILENLRNGGNRNLRQSAVSQIERVNCHKENPFDVEPSIAQKNIDIRNWLAALNFPTPPASSNEPISEGTFPMQSAFHHPNLKNNEVNPKRRKVLPNIKFSDEKSEKKDESKEKYKASQKWDAIETGGLMELIRRKSGGFVTKEQFLNSESSIRCPNVTVSFCVYSKSPDEQCLLRGGNDKDVRSDSKMFKTLELSTQPGVSISATIVNKSSPNTDQSVETDMIEEDSLDIVGERGKLRKSLWPHRRELNPPSSEVNVWKYLFLLTIFIVTVHYCFLNSSLYQYNQ